MANNTFSNRINSFKHAINGLKQLFKNEANARIHLLAAVTAVVMGLFFDLSPEEWIAIIFSIGLVVILEAVNTALEVICNYVQPEQHPKIKLIKDLAAGAVLVAAITALTVGLIVFIPKITALC